MSVAYFDCFAGCSGNMILGALIDAGCPLEELRGYLETLDLDGWELTVNQVQRNGFGALYVDVVVSAGSTSSSERPLGGSHTQSEVGVMDESPDSRHDHPDHSHAHPHVEHQPESDANLHGHSAPGPRPEAHGTLNDRHEHPVRPQELQDFTDTSSDYARFEPAPPDESISRLEPDNPTAQYVVAQHGQPIRHLSEILDLIERSSVPEPAKALACRIFTRLGEAEAKVHRTSLEHVHFHEVGAVDAIVDIVGAATAVTLMGIDEVVVSPINVGGGTVRSAHGIIPVPGPATAELLVGVPIYRAGPAIELTTPTGAAILTTLADAFGPLPAMTLDHIGYGAGTKQFEIPNLVRVLVGTRTGAPSSLLVDSVCVIEANVDDLSPQAYELAMERLFASGAFDVSLAPIQMKKNRPGIRLTVIAPPDRGELLAMTVLRETSSLGVRLNVEQRRCLPRRFETVETPFGAIRMKIATIGDEERAMPEYDDCKRAAADAGVPLREVQAAAESAWRPTIRIEG